VDLGWIAIQDVLEGSSSSTSRAPLNDKQTMASTAEDLVHWYRQALDGAFFQKPETLVEFKRIQAMGDALVKVVPPETVAYGKGGSIDWDDFHCICIAGQMIVAGVPITFCATINWTGPLMACPTGRSFNASVTEILREAVQAVG
jgi:beta-lactamase class A